MTTFTVIDSNSGEMIETGVTATEAAHIVLTDDSQEYELRPSEDGEGFDLWSRQQVANKGWTRTRFFSLADTEDQAWAEIASEVIYAGLRGPEVMTDEAYTEMLAQLAEDEE